MNGTARWPGIVLVLLGSFLAVAGIESAGNGGSVAGGTFIWVLLFGGSVVFVVCGILLGLQSSKNRNGKL